MTEFCPKVVLLNWICLTYLEGKNTIHVIDNIKKKVCTYNVIHFVFECFLKM